MKRLFAFIISLSIISSSISLGVAAETSRRELILQRRELLRVIRSEDRGSSKLGSLREEMEEIKNALRNIQIEKRKKIQLERKKRAEERINSRNSNLNKKKLNIVKIPEKTEVKTVQESPQSNIGPTELGKASYYAEKFNGRTTASGEIFSNALMTAAHKTLPFGTRVRVTNVSNGKVIEVIINDRGPFVAGRIIDLSSAAFAALDNISRGVIEVKVEVLD